jgi:hypothetical protein
VLPLYCRCHAKERRVSQAHQRCLAALRPGTVCGHTLLALDPLVRYANQILLLGGETPVTVDAMKEIILHLPDMTYARIAAEAGSAHKSPEQWILDRLFSEPSPSAPMAEPHMLLAAALDSLGFQRLEPEKAKRLGALLEVRKGRALSPDEAHELHALMSEADALEVESLQRLAAALGR